LFLREKRKRKKEVNWQRDSLFAEGQFVERVEMAAVLLFMYLSLLLLLLLLLLLFFFFFFFFLLKK